MIKTEGLTHIHLVVRDLDRSLRFYQQVFGVKTSEFIPYVPVEWVPAYYDAILSAVSDGVVVVNRDNYVGESTAREVQWAKINGKRIWWIEPRGGQARASDLVADFSL